MRTLGTGNGDGHRKVQPATPVQGEPVAVGAHVEVLAPGTEGDDVGEPESKPV